MLTLTYEYELKLNAEQVAVKRRYFFGGHPSMFIQMVANILKTLTKSAEGKDGFPLETGNISNSWGGGTAVYDWSG